MYEVQSFNIKLKQTVGDITDLIDELEKLLASFQFTIEDIDPNDNYTE